MLKRSHRYYFERSCKRSISEKRMQSYKQYIYEKHFTPDQIYVHPTRKMLKEGALPTLNLPQEITSSTTKPCTEN